MAAARVEAAEVEVGKSGVATIRRLLAEGKEPRRDGGAGPPWQGRRRD